MGDLKKPSRAWKKISKFDQTRANQYFGFIKFFPILNLDLNGASYERKEASLWSASKNGSTEISEKRSEAFRVDKKRG
jgi:hypothetical protein